MTILAARRYPTPRNGPLTPDQAETRRLAYAIKDPRSSTRDFETAAREMAELIDDTSGYPCWLVPIPSSTGNTDANTRLAHLIACHLNANAAGTMAGGAATAQVVKAIQRTHAVQSQCARHKLALGPIPPEQHHFARTRKLLSLRQTYFVDNVTTSGNTLEAARLALGFGAGLVFADAAPRRTQIQATFF